MEVTGGGIQVTVTAGGTGSQHEPGRGRGFAVGSEAAVAGSVGVSAGVLWSASSGLFYWVLNDIARHTNDVDLTGHLTGIDRENLGWFCLDDLTPSQRHEVRRIITEHLVADAQRELPADATGRASGLALLKDLAALVSDGADH